MTARMDALKGEASVGLFRNSLTHAFVLYPGCPALTSAMPAAFRGPRPPLLWA